MKKVNLLSGTIIGSALFLVSGAAAPTAALAQAPEATSSGSAPQDPPARGEARPGTAAGQGAAADEGTGEAIVVTGSRIPRPLNQTADVPVTSVSLAELTNTGEVSIGDQLNQLPALRATFGQQDSSRFLGTAGLNLLDLRGLGPQRTLVLVNGRRHVAGDILSSGVATDVNTIPIDLIDRVDIITGGDSAVYGSDAIAGVVNFVLKDRFEGIQVHGQSGISSRGDAGAYFASVVAGHNFAGGRGNIAANFEFSRQNALYASDRSYIAQQQAFVVVDTDPSGTPNGSDGTPDRLLFRDVRSATLANSGLVNIASPAGACGRDKDGKPFACTFIFQNDGTLVPQTGTRIGLAPNGNFLGGNGTTNRERNALGLFPQNTRYSLNALGHLEVSRGFVPFFEATWTHTEPVRSGSPPFFQGTTFASFSGDSREQPRLDNPFLSNQARALITQQLIAAGTNPAAITGATRFALRRNLLDLGPRQEYIKRDTYRAVVGVRGDFGTGLHYELSANYGRLDESNLLVDNLNVQRMQLAMDATRSAGGQIVCRSQVDPTAAQPLANGSALAASTLAADVAACVPLNPFGEGNISPAARNYVLQNTTSRARITQFVANGFLSGDTRGFLRLPGGPIGFAIGAEYRRETNFYTEDPLVLSGLTFYNSISTVTSPAFEVKEAFGELRLPILANVPFFHALNINAAGRIANYGGATGTVFAYNAGGDWEPFRGIKFRANYARSVRAPNLQEVYGTQSQNFAPAPLDPCSARNLGGGSSTRQANCTAAGRPANYDFVYNQSLSILSGGNPNLKAETSDSYTYGVVLTPPFLRGFSLSLDYYNIKVGNVITSPTAQQIINSCYDAPNLNNQFCSLFKRAGPGGGPKQEAPFQILDGSLQQTLLNYAQLKVRGLDVDLGYRRHTGIGDFSTHLIYSHYFQNDQYIDPTQPTFADRLLSEVSYPQDSFDWNFGWKSGIVELDYKLRYIAPQVIDTYEEFYSFNGQPPQNADFSSPSKVPSVYYHNVRLALSPTDRFTFYLGVDNLTDTKVPLGGTGVSFLTGTANTAAVTGLYDSRGRFFYAGFSTRF